MKSQVLQVKLAELKITASHSRPRVSNDNAHVESLFRTLKYVPTWPEKGFATLEEARAWVDTFVGSTTKNTATAASATSRQVNGTEVKIATCWRSVNQCIRQRNS